MSTVIVSCLLFWLHNTLLCVFKSACSFCLYRKGDLDEITKHGSFFEYLLHLHQNGRQSIAMFWWGQQRVVSICSPELFKDTIKLTNRPSEQKQCRLCAFYKYFLCVLCVYVCVRACVCVHVCACVYVCVCIRGDYNS